MKATVTDKLMEITSKMITDNEKVCISETNNLVTRELTQLLLSKGLMYAVGYFEGMVKSEMDFNPRFREEVIRHMLSLKQRAA